MTFNKSTKTQKMGQRSCTMLVQCESEDTEIVERTTEQNKIIKHNSILSYFTQHQFHRQDKIFAGCVLLKKNGIGAHSNFHTYESTIDRIGFSHFLLYLSLSRAVACF